jgi:Fe-Mn family superoxide dismutase
MTTDGSSRLDRRDFLARLGVAGAAFTMLSCGNDRSYSSPDAGQDVRLIDLPYAENALEPYISQNTISFHYGKHHRAYVDKTLKMIAGTEFEGASLVDIIKGAAGKPETSALFNNAAQVFNHAFYWQSMKPGGGGMPGGKLAAKIDATFGDYQKFAEEFSSAAASQFGSGWAWLVLDGDALKILKTANAETPVAEGLKPLLTIDVWEHAYYLDYQNRRGDYIKAFLDSLVNWDFAEKNLV